MANYGYLDQAWKLRPVIEQASQSLDDTTALKAVELFPKWCDLVKAGRTVTGDFKFRHEDQLYRVEQETFTFKDAYVPGGAGTESLFSRIDEIHSGLIEDPIPYKQNMEIFEGLFYTQNDILYLCIRDSGQPLYHDLNTLVGLYVEESVYGI